MKWASLTAALAVLSFSSPLLAETGGQLRAITPDQQLTVRPDRAYLLVRCAADVKGRCGIPLMLRMPTERENQQFHDAKLAEWKKKGPKAGPFESFPFALKGLENLYIPDFKKPLSKDSAVNTHLFEAEPGHYVVYGVGNKYSLMMCFCLGTVGFALKAGQVTDIGTVFFGRASQPSPYPELAEVTNLGPAFDMDIRLETMALRPSQATDFAPASIQHLPRVDAKFFAVGPYFEPAARSVIRLAPIPGVLAYQRGAVIDVASGKEIPPRL